MDKNSKKRRPPHREKTVRIQIDKIFTTQVPTDKIHKDKVHIDKTLTYRTKPNTQKPQEKNGPTHNSQTNINPQIKSFQPSVTEQISTGRVPQTNFPVTEIQIAAIGLI